MAKALNIDPVDAEWALIGFLLATTAGMVISNPAANYLGSRRVFLFAQWLYLLSSLGCGLAGQFSHLVIFRVLQGLGGGVAIPIGMTLLMEAVPSNKWAKMGAWINLFALIAPALGSILAGYITVHLSWPWLFFVKVPFSIIALGLTYCWLQDSLRRETERFDWLGLYFLLPGMSLFLLVLSEVERSRFSNDILLALLILSIVLLVAFFWHERRTPRPLLPLAIFRYPLFAWGNLIQSAANVVFLGGTFLISLYLQWGLGYHIVETGWVISAVTVGMILAMPLTGAFYNRLGPLPYMIVGLLLMSSAMFAFLWATPGTPPWMLACLTFCGGFGSALLQTTNFVSIFSEIPNRFKGSASSVYTILKQLSASFGVALSTMVLSIAMNGKGFENL
ncbi:MAG TPA: MFS transporter, partial [Terrimicrobiaceae bacterium]